MSEPSRKTKPRRAKALLKALADAGFYMLDGPAKNICLCCGKQDPLHKIHYGGCLALEIMDWCSEHGITVANFGRPIGEEQHVATVGGPLSDKPQRSLTLYGTFPAVNTVLLSRSGAQKEAIVTYVYETGKRVVVSTEVGEIMLTVDEVDMVYIRGEVDPNHSRAAKAPAQPAETDIEKQSDKPQPLKIGLPPGLT